MTGPVYRYDLKQSEPAWIEARLGIPTASRFDKIMSRKTGALLAARENYVFELAAEWAQGLPYEDFSNEWTEWGREHEPAARAAYALTEGVDVDEVGLVYRDGGRAVAASPDGLVGDETGCEFKCPYMLKHHLRYLAAIASGSLPREHVLQVQGCMWVTGRDRWAFGSYYPAQHDAPIPPAAFMHVRADTAIQKALDKAIPAFLGELEEAKAWLRESGVTPKGEQA